jgi:long-chain acyl-CoA synthetase
MQVEAFLENSAERYTDKIALVSGDRRLSYFMLEQSSNQLAHALVNLGVERGDRVAVCLENGVEAVVSVFGILKAGAVFSLVNSSMKTEKLSYVLRDSGAKILIAHGHRKSSIESQLPQLPELETVILTETPDSEIQTHHFTSWDAVLNSAREPSERPQKRTIDVDMAALIYTSGTTGHPKGVIMTHLNMVSAANSVIQYLEHTADDTIFNVLPLSSSYGLYQVLMTFRVGGTVVLEKSFTYPHAVLQRLIDEKATGLPIVPTISAVLLQLNLSEYAFPHLRYITNAGASLPIRHIAKLRQSFPNVRLYLMYGLTECKRVSFLAPQEVDQRPTSVGKAMPNLEAYIVDEKGMRLPPGQVGELIVRGSTVMKGYWRLPEETAKKLKPGPVPGEHVLHTGDLFKTDEQGYLYWVGRQDDIIKSRGEKVSPKEIEDVLYNLDAISMVAVFGVPDEILGEAIKAVITLRDGASLTRNEVLRHCSKNLEDHMVPSLIEFRETMPRTTAGKIDKLFLAQRKDEPA